MTFYAVYNSNDGAKSWIDSYWLNYENAVARFKELWIYEREPFQSEIDFNVIPVKTSD